MRADCWGASSWPRRRWASRRSDRSTGRSLRRSSKGFVAVGLIVAAITVTRRSRLALVYIVVVQAVIVLDVVLRLVGGLSVVSTTGVLVLALATGALALAPATRRWCDEPIW